MTKYVIIGNGVSALLAAKAIASIDYATPIKIISTNNHKTISKPALSYLLKNKLTLSQLQRLPDDFYVQTNLDMINKKVQRIDPINKQVVFTDNKKQAYDKLLLAQGSEPVIPDCGGLEKDNIITCHTLSDVQKIKESLQKITKAVVIGAGPTGLEIASVLAEKKIDVVIIEKSNYILNSIIPLEYMDIIISQYRKKGVRFILKDEVKHCGGVDNKATYVETEKGARFEAQLIILCCGVNPKIDIIEKTKIRRHRGILVDNTMKTTVKDIWSAGSVTELENEYTNTRAVLPYWNVCSQMGTVAGYNMAGKHKVLELGNNLFSCELADKQFHLVGTIECDDTRNKCSVIEDINRLEGRFLRFVFNDNMLVGACWYGRGPNPFTLKQLIDSETIIEASKKELLSKTFNWEHLLKV
jgi:NAD(P)H-nitrite reductase large subunit